MMKIRGNIKISLKTLLVVLSCFVFAFFSTDMLFQPFDNILHAKPKSTGGRKKSARSGSTKKKTSARSGSTKKKTSARSGSTKKTSARSGSTKKKTSARSGSTRKTSARSGSTRRGRSGSLTNSSINSTFNSAPSTSHESDYSGFSGSRSTKNSNSTLCMYAYVNCMDILIRNILNKNTFLGTDPAVKHLVLSDKPFRCVYAGAGNYDDYINELLDNAKMNDTSFTFMTNEHWGARATGSEDVVSEIGRNTSVVGEIKKFDASKWVFENVAIYTKELTGQLKQEGNRDVEDYWVTALYKKYNYFCKEKAVSNDRSCGYSGDGHSEYMATKESTAYYMDLSSRVRGGCSNAFVEYPIHPDDDVSENEEENKEKLRDAENRCKVSGGVWHKPNSLKMVDMSADIMSDLGADNKGICVLKLNNGEHLNDVACSKYGEETEYVDITGNGEVGGQEEKGCVLKGVTATSCKSIDKVYSNTGSGAFAPGIGQWVRKKEWAFVLNTAPPAMTINPGEEYAWAHGICMIARDIEVGKSKLKKAIKEAAETKFAVISGEGKGESAEEDRGVLSSGEVIDKLLAAKEAAKGKSYLEILKGCSGLEHRLERFYMTGEWREYKNDCDNIKNLKQQQICQNRFADTTEYADVTDIKGCEEKAISLCTGNADVEACKKSEEKKCRVVVSKKKGNNKKTVRKDDCTRHIKNVFKKGDVSVISGCLNLSYKLSECYKNIEKRKGSLCKDVKGQRILESECANKLKTEEEACRQTNNVSGCEQWAKEEGYVDNGALSAYQLLSKTNKFKNVSANYLKCSNVSNVSEEDNDKVLVDPITGDKYVSKLDTAFMTPAKSCLQYEESLKATRNAWKAKAVEAIAENSRNIANQLKKEEAKQLKADLKVNMEIAKMSNDIFSACLGGMRSCMTKEDLCGGDYKKCVDENGLRKDKLLPAGIECYAPFKTCMETTSKTLNIKNMSPQLQEIVKGLQQDPDKLSMMAIDSIGESLGDTFSKIMETECKKAGGFFYDGVCMITFVSVKHEEWAKSYEAEAKRTTTTYDWDWRWWRGWRLRTGTRSDSARVDGKANEVSNSTKYGVALPGVQINCQSKTSTKTDSNNAGTVGYGGANSSYGSSASSYVSVDCGGGVSASAGAYGSAGGSISTSVKTSATATCTMSEEILLISQNNDKMQIKPKEQSCGFVFAPKGPWEQIMKSCIKGKNKIVVPEGKKDALSIMREMVNTVNEKPVIISSGKTAEGTRFYKLVISTPTSVIYRWYEEAHEKEEKRISHNTSEIIKTPKNPNSKMVAFGINEKNGNKDWVFESESIKPAEEVYCTPKGWLINNEFSDIIKRWRRQFK